MRSLYNLQAIKRIRLPEVGVFGTSEPRDETKQTADTKCNNAIVHIVTCDRKSGRKEEENDTESQVNGTRQTEEKSPFSQIVKTRSFGIGSDHGNHDGH